MKSGKMMKRKFKVAKVFNDNMVLQQSTAVPVWGEGIPNTTVTVVTGRQQKSSAVNAKGAWHVNLDPMEASFTPRNMLISTDDPKEPPIEFKNILVGEVWLCSGQSNMKFPVSMSKDSVKEMSEADFPGIRLLTIPKAVAETPAMDIGECKWRICSPETVASFSATAYFFGRKLHGCLEVPVGLVDASVGGSIAEAWTSREALVKDPDLSMLVSEYERQLPFSKALNKEYCEEMRLLAKRTCDEENTGYKYRWADTPTPQGEWKDMELPGAWQCRGLDFSGILWFRKEIVLPVEWKGHALLLSIGAVDKSDITYFNNVKIGSITASDTTDSWKLQRNYKIPKGLAKSGSNVIAVRVHSDKFAGGMTGPEKAMRISCPYFPEAPPIPLCGIWKYAVESNYGKITVPILPPGPDNHNSPSVLYNGMIHPINRFAIRGVIWYQGESNAARAMQYERLFQALISDWRNHRGTGDLPFLFVQLPNYRLEQPVQTTWADIREAQAKALELTNTAMVVTIDIGEEDEIHPKNKQDVGLRLALNALAKVYGVKGLSSDSPIFLSAKREGDSIRIRFKHVNGGLKHRGSKLLGFEIAGADGIFVSAEAEIKGLSVIVKASDILEPRFARYAWADNPNCNLYDKADMPVAPFSTLRKLAKGRKKSQENKQTSS